MQQMQQIINYKKQAIDPKVPQKKKITLISCTQMAGNGKDIETMDFYLGQLSPQNTIILPVLKRMGYDVEIVSWEDQTIDWKNQGQLIMATPWGYNHKLEEFIKLIEYFQKQNIKLTNSTKLIKWNSVKKYHLDIQNYGILIPDTLIFEKDSELGLQQALNNFNMRFHNKDVIIKGLVDSFAEGYMHIKPQNFQEAVGHFQRLKNKFNGAIMQSFLPEISKKGQFSFVFFGGKLSHFYIKVPGSNQKVQCCQGGFHLCIKRNLSNTKQVIEEMRLFREDFQLTQEQIRFMRKQIDALYPKLTEVLKKLDIDPPAFIRIDCFLIKNKLMIMQLEAIQPYLNLGQSTEADPENNTIENYIKGVIEYA